jgi:hypothetical protein
VIELATEVKIITVNTGSSSEWENQARVMEVGEPGYNSDTKELKIGDGQSSFEELKPLGKGGFASIKVGDTIINAN